VSAPKAGFALAQDESLANHPTPPQGERLLICQAEPKPAPLRRSSRERRASRPRSVSEDEATHEEQCDCRDGQNRRAGDDPRTGCAAAFGQQRSGSHDHAGQ
jgi:hypothetical protein